MNDGMDDIGWLASAGILALLVCAVVAAAIVGLPTCGPGDYGNTIAGSFMIRGCR